MLDLRFERFIFSEVMQQAVDACQDEVDARGHSLHVSLPERRIEMVADRHRLNQVFCNLIVNAAKYSPAGQRIDVTAFVAADRLEVRVDDQGIGISPAQLSEIFEMFMQVDRSFERHGGLGIGLTLARQLVELHGGTIEARSEGIGHGSTFIVRLPIAVPALAGVAEDDEVPDAPEAQRILVADDNRDAAESLALLLRSAGHVVREALDGESALREAATFMPTVAFIDIGMPKVSGYDVARTLRAQPWGRTIHLVALTGWGQDDDRRRSAEAGFDHHVVKPVSHEELTKLLRSVGARAAPVDPVAPRGA
jgi:CheY-like chemotaxis protein